MPGTQEIIFYGKSGDGIHMVVDRLVQDLIKRGLYVTAYSEYDPEKRESVAKVHVRVAKGPIDVRGPVTNPEIAVLMDFRMLGQASEALGARKIIVNAPSREFVTKYVGNIEAEVYTVNLYALKKTGGDYVGPLIDLVMRNLDL